VRASVADVDSRAGARYATPEVLDWTARVHAAHDAALEGAFSAPERFGLPAIQVAPSEGKLLTLLLTLAGVRRAVEIGTLAGYSAIRIARALPPDGRLFTIEADPKHAAVARRVLDDSEVGARVTIVEGKALDVLPGLEREGPFDAVFVDADKAGYDRYGRWAAANVRRGGLLLGDNAYLFGRLLEESDEAAAMRRFHEEARAHFDTVCIPTPDGLLLGVRR
jgi:predicted O-methyltransferase YrrM